METFFCIDCEDDKNIQLEVREFKDQLSVLSYTIGTLWIVMIQGVVCIANISK